MYRRRGISLIAILLLLACLTQAAFAAADETGNESSLAAIDSTPTVTVAPEPTVNESSGQVAIDTNLTATAEPSPAVNESPDQGVIDPTPTVTAEPEPTVVATVEPVVPEETPVPTVTPEGTVATPVEPVETTSAPTPEPEVMETPAVEPVETTAAPTPEPEVTETPAVEPAVTTPAPETTPAENITIQETIPQEDTLLAQVNPAFSHYLDVKNLGRASAVGQGHSLGYIPPPVNLTHLKGRRIGWAAVDAEAEASGTDLLTQEAQAGIYQPVYDLRTLGKVTPVRDQGSCGACWAFATYGSLESTLLPRETWDFSENNMINTNGYDIERCLGGSDIIAMAYLSRWDGPVNELADPYTIDALFSPSDLKTRKHAQGMYIVPQRMDYTDNSNLKAAIMNYGGVYSAMYWNDLALNATYPAYYAEYPDWPNHAITLVGWDDTYSRDRFLTIPVDWEGNPFPNEDGTPYVSVPPGDGAFIAKNSWGTGFGENGFFYISYYDSALGFVENTVFTAEPLKNLKNIYQYDDLGWVGNLGTGDGSDTAWFANVFRAQEKASVAAVSFYTPTANSEYTVSLHLDPANGPVNDAGPVATRIGTFELAGYHTVDIEPPVPVDLGQRFSVVVKLRTPEYSNPIPLEVQIPGYTSSVVAHPGESYKSSDGSTWTDITEIQLDPDYYPDIKLGSVCLKAFTVPASPPPDARFTAAPKKGKAPVKVSFRDRSLRRPQSWLWDFGDGTTSTEQNPVHTYMNAGTFTVNLTVKNSVGEDFTSKEAYITVGEGKVKARPYYDFKKKDDDTIPPDR